MCLEMREMQISNRNKNGFFGVQPFRGCIRIGATGIRDLLAFGRQVTASGDK